MRFPAVYSLEEAPSTLKNCSARLKRFKLVLVGLALPKKQLFSVSFTEKVENSSKMMKKMFHRKSIFFIFSDFFVKKCIFLQCTASRKLRTDSKNVPLDSEGLSQSWYVLVWLFKNDVFLEIFTKIYQNSKNAL